MGIQNIKDRLAYHRERQKTERGAVSKSAQNQLVGAYEFVLAEIGEEMPPPSGGELKGLEHTDSVPLPEHNLCFFLPIHYTILIDVNEKADTAHLKYVEVFPENFPDTMIDSSIEAFNSMIAAQDAVEAEVFKLEDREGIRVELDGPVGKIFSAIIVELMARSELGHKTIFDLIMGGTFNTIKKERPDIMERLDDILKDNSNSNSSSNTNTNINMNSNQNQNQD